MSAQNVIAFQGELGAFSHVACTRAFPEMEPLPCTSFDEAFDAIPGDRARLAMIPIENSTAGRVADIHHLLPERGLHIVGEHFQPVEHQLLGVPGATLESIQTVHSHIHALSQCRRFLRANQLTPVVDTDTAGAAHHVAQAGDPTRAAIASGLAGKIYGLEVISSTIQDNQDNTTRFCVMAEAPLTVEPGEQRLITTIVFRARSVPAALYKALGGFATNGVNLTKLESYIIDGAFTVAQFYADFEGHPQEPSVVLALEELVFFTEEVKVLGTYPASSFRKR